MHPKLQARRILTGIVVLFLMVGGTVSAQPVDQTGAVIVPIGGAVRMQMKTKKPIRQFFNDKPNVVAAGPDGADPSYVILRGLSQGTTKIELTDADGIKESYVIIVQTDIELLRNILKRAVPTANINVIPAGANVILSGMVAKAEDVDPILRITAAVLGITNTNFIVNALNVGGVQQVQLDVVVARVDRTKARNRGFNFVVNGTTFSTGSVLGGLASSSGSAGNNTVATGVGIIPGAASMLPTGAANLVFGIIPANFQGLLQALKTEGLSKLVAEPRLVTQSGRPARFLSGGQQATLSPASGINGPGVVYQDIGTELEFLPIVYGNGKIYLEVAPRVRSVNNGLGITTTFGTVPGFDDQQMRTSVVLEPGQTFAIGGLIQTTVNSGATRVPVLGEIPFLGPWFSTSTTTEDEQELVILVTPHLVDPMDCKQVPPRLPGKETRQPDDFEFYLEGLLELPRGQRLVFENKHYKAPWKNDPTAATFPCGVGTNPYHGTGVGAGGVTCTSGTCNTSGVPVRPAPKVLNIGPSSAPADLPSAANSPIEVPASPRGR